METIQKTLLDVAKYGNNMEEMLFSKKSGAANEYQKGNIIFHKSEDGIYGKMQSAPVQSCTGDLDAHLLKDVTYGFYKEMFDLIADFPGYQFVRVWNYVPLIVEDTEQTAPDVEVYRCFNAGRYKAFEEVYGNDRSKWIIPAATAVGGLDDSLVVEFFASPAPTVYFENRIQIPAYQYSKKYGKLPPVFTRGSVCELKDTSYMFISGTASVVNEDTIFVGDINGQISQTFNNIQVLIGASNLEHYGLPYGFTLSDLEFLRVFYKNKSDLEIIKREVGKIIPEKCEVTYLHTDICRKELVIEIEGVCTKEIY